MYGSVHTKHQAKQNTILPGQKQNQLRQSNGRAFITKSTEQSFPIVLYFFSFALCYDQIFIKRTFAINQTFRD